MSKIIYDVIQRFEVENGVPRLVSTNIQVIQGGEDLLSLAIGMLTQMGFYEKFEEKRASQYIGYRLKNPGKGTKRYQLVFAQRKEDLCISIPQAVLEPYILTFNYNEFIDNESCIFTIGRILVIPSRKDIFLESLIPQLWEILQVTEKISGDVELNKSVYDGYDHFVVPDSEIIPKTEFQIETISDNKSYLILSEDKLFSYTWQVCINSREVLEAFIPEVAKILMEQN